MISILLLRVCAPPSRTPVLLSDRVRSMTGHGRGVHESAGRRATVEIRSVNHRFFDLKLRAPWGDPRLEDKVGQGIRRRAERGSFTVTVRDESGGAGGAVKIDLPLARATAVAMEELRRAVNSSDHVPLMLIAAQPGVLQIGEAVADPDAVFAGVAPALEGALDELVAMRRREGETLAADLAARFAHIEALAGEIEGLSRATPEEYRRRLMERVGKLLSGAGVPVDEARIAQEVAILADRIDITEELVRLRSHLGQMRGLLGEDSPVGRRLDFLTQELAREVNTIGSKSQSAEIAARVVSAKAEVEKIREQVQNVE
jgi:uncharacterized protein (TIGR00255 family)